MPIDTAALSRVVDGKEVKGEKKQIATAKVFKRQAALYALPAFSFPFWNGKQSKAQRAAAMPLPFGLPFRPRGLALWIAFCTGSRC